MKDLNTETCGLDDLFFFFIQLIKSTQIEDRIQIYLDN